jgi:hypothetical protein
VWVCEGGMSGGVPLCLTAGRAGRLGVGLSPVFVGYEYYMLYIANIYFIIHCLKCFRDFVFIIFTKIIFSAFQNRVIIFYKI